MTHVFLMEITLAEHTALTEGSSDASGGHTTLDYITGTTLLGAFVNALRVQPTEDLFRQLFLSPSTRFLNAYPGGNDNARALPRPLTFRVGKLNPKRTHDAIRKTGEPIAHEEMQKYFAAGELHDTMKNTRNAFVTEHSPAFNLSPTRIEQVHVGIDRKTRTAENGVLFTYEAIRSGATFRGAIETEYDSVAELLAKQNTLRLRLGRSRGAGYGNATASLYKVTGGWKEYSSEATQEPRSAVLTLLSDYLPHLETAPVTALRAELADRTGVDPHRIEVRRANTRQVRGFRGIWGLPRPARTALTKGSVLVIVGGADTGQITEVLASGLGARTNEGFGRIAVNWSIHGKATDGMGVSPAGATVTRLSRPSTEMHATAAAAINARRTERRVREFVEVALRLERVCMSAKALCSIPPAQLGNLRAAVSGTMSPTDIGKWFKDLSEKTGGERWRSVNVPPLAGGRPQRAGHAFVWESLFGGTCTDHDSLDGDIAPEDWRSVIQALAKQVARSELCDPALQEPEATLRYFIAGLVADVTRRRNTHSTQEAKR